MGKIRDAARTRARIVDAARKEFSAHGFAGARMERIAQRANAKKQLIYHYFAGKEALFQEAYRWHPETLEPYASFPADPSLLLERRFEKVLGNVDWTRLLTWESAYSDGRKVPAEAERAQSIAHEVNFLRTQQATGSIPAGLDPQLLQLAIYALATYPVAFSQVTRLVTGHSGRSPAFRRQWKQFLRLLGSRILAATANADPPASAASTRPAGKNGVVRGRRTRQPGL